MNKLARRVLAFMLMACLLIALVPAVASAETATPYVVDFEIDTREDLTWIGNGKTYTFAGTNFPHALTSQGNAGWLEAFNAYYDNGTIDFSFPHTVITQEMVDAGEAQEANIGKVADDRTVRSYYKNPSSFGSYLYSNTATEYNFTGLKLQSCSTGAGGPSTGWNLVLLRAPEAGEYDVTLEYTKVAAAGSAKIYMLPYTAAMKAQVENDVDAWHAYITGIVNQGTEAESYVGAYSGWISAGSDSEPGQVCDLGDMTVGVDVDQYLMIVAVTAGKATHIQNVTFTPKAEQEIAAETIERNYSIAGAVKSTISLQNTDFTVNTDGVAAVEALYDAGTIDWSWIGTNSKDTQGLGVELQKAYLYNQTVLANVTGTENDTHAYEAYKLRSPGAGMYNISFTSYVAAAGKTAAWSDVYIAEYTEGMDPLSIVTEANFVGAHTPKSSANPTSGKTYTTAVGEFEFAKDKEYILVHKADGIKYGWPTSSVDATNDRHYTANFYMAAFVIEPQEAPITFVPKAYIGTTPYATVAAAAAAAKAGDTIKLAVDFLGNIDLPAGVSLDLAGNDWTVTNLTTTNGSETVIDSVGGGNLIAKSIDLFGGNSNVLPLATAANTYTLADYTMTVDADDYEAVGEATRFWFKLDLADEYLDLIAGGESGLTIGVELSWGGAEDLAVTFEGNNGAEAFAAEWAATYKAGNNVWLYVDITGIDALASDLTVTPVLQVSDTTLNVGSLVYEIA